jgi:hypothetical protein
MHKIFKESIEIWYVEQPSSLPLILAGLKNKVASFRILNKGGLQYNNTFISDRALFSILILRYIRLQLFMKKTERKL